MPRINSNVDLGKSFEKLMKDVISSHEKVVESDSLTGFVAGYKDLRLAIERHVNECVVNDSVVAADPDDLSQVNI